FNIKMHNRFLNWTALALWIVGVVCSFIVISSVASEFRSRETQRIDIPISQPVSDTLFIDLLNQGQYKSDSYYINNHRINGPWDVTTFLDSIRIGEVSLDVVKSTTTNFELVQITSSRGKDRRDANENARKVEYGIEQENSKIKFDETFYLPPGTKYRAQKIQLILKVPVGKSVFMSEEMSEIIYDIKNVTNTYDGDMVGKTWTMTERGLECIGCNLPDSNFKNKNDVRIRIDGKGVKVEGNDDASDSSFTINSDDVDIKINSDGVQIDTKKK
ncbi:MAG TPA: hypothetical protein PKD91_10690, partial [Bacteroidia bacterium]|nr:hypothetical protein [Bacteroidia bacterium]